MNSIKHIIDSIVDLNDRPLDNQQIIDIILPRRADNSSYSIHDVDDKIYPIRDEVEALQREKNDHFDEVLDESVKIRLENLYQNLHNIQLNVMKLQCDIAFTKEQYYTVKNKCDNSIVHEYRDSLGEEILLRKSLQEQIFKPATDYFNKLLVYFTYSIENCRSACTYQSANLMQSFDWTQYYQIIALIRACAKAIVDVDRFERLHQKSELVQIIEFKFKQPLDQLELNDFVEFPDAYSLETQLMVTRNGGQENQSFKEFLTNNKLVNAVITANEPIPYLMYEFTYQKLRQHTIDCCTLLVALNMNYIEANLTDGINIDKLNGTENPNRSMVQLEEQQALPIYAFSPQEYITQIGQHLLTLRKQTEQFDQGENRYLKFGIEHLKDAQDIPVDLHRDKTITKTIMRCITGHTIRSLLGRTTQSVLNQLTTNGRRQLATDALYLDNVLEDLGLLDSDEPNVQKFKSLLMQ